MCKKCYIINNENNKKSFKIIMADCINDHFTL